MRQRIRRACFQGAVFALGKLPHRTKVRLRQSPAHSAYLGLMDRISNGLPEDAYVIRGGPLIGSRLIVDPNRFDRRCLFGLHEPAVADMLIEHCRTGYTAVDVGAYCGYFTLLLAKCVGPNGRCLAIEPNPVNAGRVRQAVRLNDLARVEVIESAVTDHDGAMTFLLEPTGTMGRLAGTVDDTMAFADAIEVSGRALDSVLDELQVEKVDLVKIDVEGAEDLVLDGFRRRLERDRPILMIEVHAFDPPEAHARPLTRRLKDLGYHVVDVATRTELDPDRFAGGHILGLAKPATSSRAHDTITV